MQTICHIYFVYYRRKDIELELDHVGRKTGKHNGIGELDRVNNNEDEANDNGDDDLYRCGLGPFKYGWMQKFATRRAFILIYSLLAVVQSMSWAYFSASITTLEKRFKISTKTAGRLKTVQFPSIAYSCDFP
jgi:hypothetical protein